VNRICRARPTAITSGFEEHKTIYAKRRTALGRYGDPEEVAHALAPAAGGLFGLTGSAVIPVDGGLMARNANLSSAGLPRRRPGSPS
jgi:3-oxoacyl-[acyl-carrier protein] reductase